MQKQTYDLSSGIYTYISICVKFDLGFYLFDSSTVNASTCILNAGNIKLALVSQLDSS